MLQGNYPLGFKLSLHRKDLGIALETANSVELDMPITALRANQKQTSSRRAMAMTTSRRCTAGTQ